jgi:hypothetical protein
MRVTASHNRKVGPDVYQADVSYSAMSAWISHSSYLPYFRQTPEHQLSTLLLLRHPLQAITLKHRLIHRKNLLEQQHRWPSILDHLESRDKAILEVQDLPYLLLGVTGEVWRVPVGDEKIRSGDLGFFVTILRYQIMTLRFYRPIH